MSLGSAWRLAGFLIRPLICALLVIVPFGRARAAQDERSPQDLLKEAESLQQAGKLDQAIEDYRLILKRYPDVASVRSNLGAALAGAGRYQEAIAQAQGLPEGPFLAVKLGTLGEAYAGAGELARAESIVKELDELAESGYVSLRSRVYVHCGLGEWDRVLPDLDRCYEDHSPWLATLKVDPRFDPLREQERFVELLRSMGLG